MGDTEASPLASRFACVVRWWAVICAVMQCVLGIVVLKTFFDNKFCSDLLDRPAAGVEGIFADDVICLGPHIRWAKSDGEYSFTDDVNGMAAALGELEEAKAAALADALDGGRRRLATLNVEGATYWRAVFSFQLETFVDLWTPLIFGLLSLSLHMTHTRMDMVSDNWIRFSIWFLVTALWAAFGYAGNLGIITGFLHSVTAILALVCVAVCPHELCVMDLAKQLNIHMPNLEFSSGQNAADK